MHTSTIDKVNELHKKYAPHEDALTSVLEHCRIVRSLALQIADNHPTVNRDLLEVGALLHDIGVYKLYNKDGTLDETNYLTHGLEGYKLLKSEGLDEVVCRFALLHTGVGISAKEVEEQKLPLPKRDYIADTYEEKIVMYADKFHSKTNPPTFNSADWYENYLRNKFGDIKADKFASFIKEFGNPDLSALQAKYDHALR